MDKVEQIQVYVARADGPCEGGVAVVVNRAGRLSPAEARRLAAALMVAAGQAEVVS